MKSTVIAGLATLVVVGCGSGTIPLEQIASAQGAVRAAREMGAEKAPPDAQLHLRLAREAVESAKRLVADGDNTRAEWLLRRAEADAELALQLAREHQVKEASHKVVEELRLRKSKAPTVGPSADGVGGQ